MRAIDSITVETGLQKPYSENASFMFSLDHEEDFDGCEENVNCGVYSPKLNREIPQPMVEPLPERQKVECCIRALSRMYWKFQDEYRRTYGDYYNG